MKEEPKKIISIQVLFYKCSRQNILKVIKNKKVNSTGIVHKEPFTTPTPNQLKKSGFHCGKKFLASKSNITTEGS